MEKSIGTDDDNSNEGIEKKTKFATEIVDHDLSALHEIDTDLKNGDEEDKKNKKFSSTNCQTDNIKVRCPQLWNFSLTCDTFTFYIQMKLTHCCLIFIH